MKWLKKWWLLCTRWRNSWQNIMAAYNFRITISVVFTRYQATVIISCTGVFNVILSSFWTKTMILIYWFLHRITFGPRHVKRAQTTWHVISSNLHLKSSAKNGGSNNCFLFQGAIYTVSIVISGLLSPPSCHLENGVGKKA